jgi:hypothetical protein
MSETKHTPGPWYENGPGNIYGADLDPTEFRANGEAIPPNSRCVAHMVQGHHITPSELAANALLIASSPDLLAACRGMLSILEDTMPRLSKFHGNETIEAARAAISKAVGE